MHCPITEKPVHTELAVQIGGIREDDPVVGVVCVASSTTDLTNNNFYKLTPPSIVMPAVSWRCKHMKSFRSIISLLFSIFVFSSMICFSLAAEGEVYNNTAINNPLELPYDAETGSLMKAQGAMDETEYLALANQNLDRSLNLLNSILNAIMILLTLFTIFVAIAGIVVAPLVGNYLRQTYKKIQDIKTEAEEIKTEAGNTHKKLMDLFDDAQKEVAANTANVGLIPIEKTPSKETLEKLEDFEVSEQSLNLLETFGVKLRFEDYMNLASSKYYKKRYEESLLFLDKALQVKPDNPSAWSNKGVVLSDLGRHDEAMKAYEKAIKIKPDFHKAWYNRGASLSRLSRYEDAIKAYEKAIEIKPDTYEAWYNKGLSLSDLGRREEAIKAYEKVIEIKPDKHEAWFNKGTHLSKLGRHDEAIKAYEKAIEIKLDKHEAWFNKACTLSLMRKADEAIESLKHAIELKPSKREQAREDTDFDNIKDDPRFRKLVFGE